MYSVKYHRADSIENAKSLAASAEAKYLSGGMTLIPAMKTRLAAPSDLVDLSKIDALKGIRVEGKTVTIGAATTHYEIATSADIAKACPALTDMAKHIGDPAVRYKGTIGGSIANNDPAADYPAAMIANDATIVTDKRRIKADDFFTGLFETALEEGEIVTGVTFEAPEKCGYEKFRNPASRYAMTGVFVAKKGADIRVAVTGAGENGVFRAEAIEQALSSNFSADAVKSVKISPDGLMGDIHASPEYRANLVVVMAKRAAGKAAAM